MECMAHRMLPTIRYPTGDILSSTTTPPPPQTTKKQEYVYRLKSRRHLSEFQDRLLSTLARPYDDAAFGAAGGVDTRGECVCMYINICVGCVYVRIVNR